MALFAWYVCASFLLRPEEIEELMHSMNRPTVAHTLREDRETGDDLLRALLRQPGDPAA